MKTTCTCGATWTGLRIEHCTACHETFTGTSAGDKHRTGDHAISLGPYRRRCLTPVEMAQRGMVRNDRGVWTLGGANPWARDDAGATNGGEPDADTGDTTNAAQIDARRLGESA